MRWHLSFAAVLTLVTAACSGTVVPGAAQPPAPPEVDPARAILSAYLDPDAFSDPTTIDNPWFPLEPGTRFVWEGEAIEDDERIERRVVFTVTDLTKDIGGITTLVGWDRDYNDGELVEAELIFLAQADDGTVWHFGQYAEVYSEEGELDGAVTWLAGYLEGAEPGIVMKGDPRPGTPEYSQGFAPAPLYWDDRARVDRVGAKTCVPVDCYRDVLVIEEFEVLKPGASQLKYYARGVGTVRVGWRGDDDEQETMVLTKVTRLGAATTAEVRREAEALEARASMYGGAAGLVPLEER